MTKKNMALTKRLLVNVLESKKISFIGKEAEHIEKFKYTVLNSDQEMSDLYSDTKREDLEAVIIDTDTFVESKAVEINLVGRLWEGSTRWSLKPLQTQ